MLLWIVNTIQKAGIKRKEIRKKADHMEETQHPIMMAS